MIYINGLIAEMKSLYKVEGVHTIRFDLPVHERFLENKTSCTCKSSYG